MAEPTLTDLLAACKTLLESVPGRKYKVLGLDESLSFDDNEDPAVLRSDLDLVASQGGGPNLGRINAWYLTEQSFAQENQPVKTGYAAPGPCARKIRYEIRLEYFYEMLGGVANCRAVVEQARQLFNNNPQLGLAPAQANFIDQRHGGLQMVLATEGDFRTATAFIRVFTISVPVIETP